MEPGGSSFTGCVVAGTGNYRVSYVQDLGGGETQCDGRAGGRRCSAIAGREHLTLLDIAPPEFVIVAAATRFDTVGLRVRPVTPDEETWPVYPGSPMLAETLRRCGGTELFMLDVEAVGPRSGSDLQVRTGAGDGGGSGPGT